MTPGELTTRVTLDTCAAVAALATVAAWLGGAPASAWLVGAGLRFAACTAACALLLTTGWAHPVALVAGFTVLPCDLIARGLAASRAER